MATDRKKQLFDHYRQSLCAAGLDTKSEDMLLCPLCWLETPYDALSYEHIVPGSVGGSRRILTCTKCNNQHGSTFDSHLARFQAVKDGFEEHGTTPAKISAHGYEVAANIEWGDGYKNIHIVSKASNPKNVSALQAEFQAGNVGSLNLTLLYGYIKNRFQTALLRCAYLAIFKCFSYEYAKHEVVQIIRRRICAPSLEHPRPGSLLGELRDCKIPYTDSYFVVPGNVNGVEFFQVIICLRKETTTYHFVFMPVPVARSDEFYDIMEQCSRENDGKTLTLPQHLIFT